MHIHILGICGTFMGGLAIIARQMGMKVTGSDAGVYPPMSTLLEEQGIDLREGYAASHLQPAPDLVVVGNAMTRGNPSVEYMLDKRLPFTSGPQWLSERVLQSRRVLAVAGTHGKTTPASILAWLLQSANLEPGFLIGGVPLNFGVSARLTASDIFVIEADEYDSAFFDKRSKFVHYRPTLALLNNLEFDHADIFDDIAAIRRQFHHLVRTIPSNGHIVVNGHDAELATVLEMGCWTSVDHYIEENAAASVCQTSDTDQAARWSARRLSDDCSTFTLLRNNEPQGDVHWSLIGAHNMHNALGAVALAHRAGVDSETIRNALASFQPPKRRLELKVDHDDIQVFDDFAHHPTAVAGTLDALRSRFPDNRVIAVFEPRSNSMKQGAHRASLQDAMTAADLGFILLPDALGWTLSSEAHLNLVPTTDQLFHDLMACIRPGDRICIMSNGAFDGLPGRLAGAIIERH